METPRRPLSLSRRSVAKLAVACGAVLVLGAAITIVQSRCEAWGRNERAGIAAWSAPGVVVQTARLGDWVVDVSRDPAGRVLSATTWRDDGTAPQAAPPPPPIIGGVELLTDSDRARLSQGDSVVEHFYGWPLPAMATTTVVLRDASFGDSDLIVVHGAPFERKSGSDWPPSEVLTWFTLPLVDWAWQRGIAADRPGPAAFPTRIAGPGFVVNSAIYGGAAVLFYFMLRRGLTWLMRSSATARSRRGECRACGHPLAGLPRCPECGVEPPRPARS